jgi:dTMP kinase
MTEPEFRSEAIPAEGLGAGAGGYGRLIRSKNFRRLWVSQVISGIGDWLVIGLLIPLVLQLSNGSATAVAGIMIAKIIPSLLYGSVLGVLVDRFDRRRLMIVCDLTQMVLALGLLLTDNLAFIYLIVLLMETMGLMFYPAKNALIPKLVQKRDLAVANGLSYTTQQASMLVGLTMSAAIIAVFERIVRFVIVSNFPIVPALVGFAAPYLLGQKPGVFLDSMSFLVSAIIIARIHIDARAEGASGRLDFKLIGKDVVDSFRFLAGHQELRGFLIAIGLAILGGGAIIPVGSVYVESNLTHSIPFLDKIPALERLTSSSQTFMLVFLALGMVTGALVVPRLARRLPLTKLFVSGIAGFGLSMLGFSLVGIYGIAGIFGVFAGYFLAQVTVTGNTYVAQTVADEVRGRVFTAMESVIRVALLLSMIVTAPLGDLVGKFVRDAVLRGGRIPGPVVFTGSRITLVFASTIVLLAAGYAARTIGWRGNGRAKEGTADAAYS